LLFIPLLPVMKVAIVGCGALGSYYGARLCRAGHETHFLLRSDYEAVRAHGVRVGGAAGDFVAHPHCARRPEEIGVCDWVIIGLKATANAAFPELLPPLVGAPTAVLTLQNGLGNEEALAALFPAEQILGGLCYVSLNRLAPGRIAHLAHGRIALGEFRRPPQPRTERLAGAFRQADVPCDVVPDLALAHWEKLVWNIPFNGLGTASCAGLAALQAGAAAKPGRHQACLTTDRLLADAGWSELVEQLMTEVRSVAAALGHVIPEEFARLQVRRTREMAAYRPSTLVDFEAGLPLELDALFREPQRQARAAGVVTPLLDRLCAVLAALAPATAK
jgi:2-dehydropantoate 2-reductase